MNPLPDPAASTFTDWPDSRDWQKAIDSDQVARIDACLVGRASCPAAFRGLDEITVSV
jgi:hypothetical protein